MFDKPNLESVSRYRTTRYLIADALREAIQCGELKSGQPLPQEEFAIICFRGVPDSISRDRWGVHTYRMF